MSSKAAVVCDGCGVAADSNPYPLGWRRLKVSGRRDQSATMTAVYWVDICSLECAGHALEEAEIVTPGVGRLTGAGVSE